MYAQADVRTARRIVPVDGLNAGRAGAAWSRFWYGYAIVLLTLSGCIAVWLTVGGFVNLRELFRLLKTARRNTADDGTVVAHQSLADVEGNPQ